VGPHFQDAGRLGVVPHSFLPVTRTPMCRLSILLMWLLSLVFVSSAVGDIPPPHVRPKNETVRVVAPVTVRHGALRGEARDVQAKIVIPKHLVEGERVRAAPAAPASAAPEAPATAPRATSPRKEARSAPLGTVIAGLALSLAAVSLVFAARGSRTAKTATVTAFATVLGIGAVSALYADVVPPGKKQAETTIVIELVDDGQSVTLLLPR
jgi:hypothetical protein